MKKSNWLLIVLSCVALFINIFFHKMYRSNFLVDVSWKNFAISGIIFAFVPFCFLVFTVRNRALLFAMVLSFGAVLAWADLDCIYTVFPMLLILWYINTLLDKKDDWLIPLFYSACVFSLGVGVFILINKQSGTRFWEHKTVLLSVFYAGLLFILLLFIVFWILQKREKKTTVQKLTKEGIDNHLVGLSFVVIVLLIECIWFWCKCEFERLLSYSLVVMVPLLLVYVFNAVRTLQNKTDFQTLLNRFI